MYPKNVLFNFEIRSSDPKMSAFDFESYVLGGRDQCCRFHRNIAWVLRGLFLGSKYLVKSLFSSKILPSTGHTLMLYKRSNVAALVL